MSAKTSTSLKCLPSASDNYTVSTLSVTNDYKPGNRFLHGLTTADAILPEMEITGKALRAFRERTPYGVASTRVALEKLGAALKEATVHNEAPFDVMVLADEPQFWVQVWDMWFPAVQDQGSDALTLLTCYYRPLVNTTKYKNLVESNRHRVAAWAGGHSVRHQVILHGTCERCQSELTLSVNSKGQSKPDREAARLCPGD